MAPACSDLAIGIFEGTGGIARDDSSRGHVARDNCAGRDLGRLADRHAREDDCARADARSSSDMRVEIQTAGHVMGQHDGVRTYRAAFADVDAARPGAIDERRRSDPCARSNIHAPQVLADKRLPTLPQRKRFGLGRAGYACHPTWHIQLLREAQSLRLEELQR